tara:strand:- start:337 stop:732 length:396 start_codon:yes stop_codon:yes gene_type:complete
MRSKSAGVVVVRKFDDGIKVLCLKKFDGIYDITKGIVDDGESDIETALREVQEESGIVDLRFDWGLCSKSYGMGRVFLASTEQDAFVGINPETGQKEHESYAWLSFDEAINLVEDFLVDAIVWAKLKVSGV